MVNVSQSAQSNGKEAQETINATNELIEISSSFISILKSLRPCTLSFFNTPYNLY